MGARNTPLSAYEDILKIGSHRTETLGFKKDQSAHLNAQQKAFLLIL